MFPAKRREFKIGERNGHGKSRNGHGKVMEKYFVKSVGTLRISLWGPGGEGGSPYHILNLRNTSKTVNCIHNLHMRGRVCMSNL